VQQHPLLQQALQHPLLARQIMQQYPWLHQILQQRLMQPYSPQPQPWFGGQAGQFAQPFGPQFGSQFGADPYSTWQQQQTLGGQFRGMQPFQPGQLMGQGIQGMGQAGGQTLH
jgi:hypothetical protein